MTKRLIGLTVTVACACIFVPGAAPAGTITLGGTITQDTLDVGSPAVANPALNSIQDGDAFTITLDLANPISSPGLLR